MTRTAPSPSCFTDRTVRLAAVQAGTLKRLKEMTTIQQKHPFRKTLLLRSLPAALALALLGTGFRPGIFRFPGGSQYSNKYLGRENCLRAVRELGYEWIDWSCNACDAGPKENRPSAEGEAQFLIWQVKTMPIAVILSHDWIWATRDALPIAIPKLQEMGYVFLPLFPESTTMGEATKILFP